MLHQFKFAFVLILCMRLCSESEAASEICTNCTCTDSETRIDCSSRGLKSVPQPIPSKVVHLNLQNNNIEKTETESFRDLSNLATLELDGNKIKEIESGTFKNLPSLTTLTLSNNDVREVKADIFQKVPRLTLLELGGNKIKEIESGTFKNLPSLTTLSLWNNAIRKIKAETFQNLSRLSTLNLRNNNITEIKANTFKNVSRLKHLNLGGNNIKEIKAGTFQYLSSLTHLSLWGNKIHKIKAKTFQNLSRVKEIYLRNSQIQSFEDGTFLFLPSLTLIDLKENKDMICGCHLPALVNYMNRSFNVSLDVKGECRIDSSNNQSKLIRIMDYSQCENYSLFQRNLQCETCSRMTCNASEVTHCTRNEPVCRRKLSTNGFEVKFEKSCSTYRKCLDDIKSNALTCNTGTGDTSCTVCCTAKLCDKNESFGLNNSFVFHLVINSMLNNYKEAIVAGLRHELSNLAGTFEVTYCGFEKKSEVFTITCTVPDTASKDRIFQDVSEISKTYWQILLLELRLPQGDAELIDGMFCNENTTLTSNGAFYWPMTKTGTTVTIPCQANVATRYCNSPKMVHSEMAKKCSPFTGIWQEPDMSQCNITESITQQLKNITRKGIDEENVKGVSTELRNITKKSAYFKPEDIDLAVKIHEKMVPLISNMSTDATVNNILFSINDLINTPEEILVEAEKSQKTGNRMLDVIEAIPEEIPLEEKQQLTAIYSNVGIGVTKVENDTFNGVVYAVLFGNNETEAKTKIYNTTYAETPLAERNRMDFISLPRGLMKHLNDEALASISRISFVFLRNDKIQRVIQKSTSEANAKINSHIIGANIPNVTITNLDEPVTISFNLIDQNVTRLQCVYWDEIHGNWSGEGCKRSNDGPGTTVLCSCNHLTSFALIVDVNWEGNGPYDEILSILSNIGCGISFVCLILTIIIYVCSKNLRKLLASKILVNLCISLALTNLIFLVGMQPYASTITAVCKTVAALMHYFLLASLTWMAVEALHVFLGVFIIFRTYQASFMMRSSILAWGLPGVIVIITLAINETNNYIRIEHAQVCWLSKIPLYAAFLAPVVTILLFNIIIFVIVIWHLVSIQSTEIFEHESRKIRLWGIVGLIFLFGLSWLLALFTFGDGTVVFKFLFIIFNTLQGLFIFVFYCLYKEDTRDVICLCLCYRERRSRYPNDFKSRRYSESTTKEETL